MPEIVVGRDEDDLREYGTKGTLSIGKHLVGTGEESHLTTPVLLDVLRPHIIMISGKRGEGKCMLPKTPIMMSGGSTVAIEDIFFMIKKDNSLIDEEFLFCDKNIEILSLNEKLEIMPKNISHVYRKKINEKILKIRTRTKKQVSVTKEHPLLALNISSSENLFYAQWKESVALKVGEKIASVNGNSIFWDEITEIEEINYNGYVYDLTIPDTHNFIGSGVVCHNSFSMGVLVEEIMKLPENIRQNVCAIVIDTQGIFWTMKSPNEKELVELNKWGLKPKGFDVQVYVPEGQEETFTKAGVDFDAMFSFQPSELSADDWMNVFSLDPNEPLGILMQKTFVKLSGQYSIDDIIEMIKRQEGFENEKLALENRFEAAKRWGIFGSAKMPDMLIGGKVSIIDVSLTPQNVRALLVGLACKKIFIERVKARRKEELAEVEVTSMKRTPMPWILIDEAHNFIPNKGKTAATDVLGTLVKEGRQPGITLVFATQRPEKLHADALAQCDMIISHRLTAKADIDALRAIMQTYMLYDISKYINELPRMSGAAIILDDNSERLYKVRIRPRQSWHAGESPVAI